MVVSECEEISMAKTVNNQTLEDLFELNRDNRKNTLNKRINYKGNYENYITGGSRALDNQASLIDANNVANAMAVADPNGIGADWTIPEIKHETEGLNNRYENRDGQSIKYAPSTKRGRRLADIYFTRGSSRIMKSPNEIAEMLTPSDALEKIRKYEGK